MKRPIIGQVRGTWHAVPIFAEIDDHFHWHIRPVENGEAIPLPHICELYLNVVCGKPFAVHTGDPRMVAIQHAAQLLEGSVRFPSDRDINAGPAGRIY